MNVAWTGHVWTIGPTLAAPMQQSPPLSSPWKMMLHDPHVGQFAIHGRLHLHQEGAPLAILLHGLGGSPNSEYIRKTAFQLSVHGWSSLSVALRGADKRDCDLHHAGLTKDIHAIIASPALRRVKTIYVIGFSIGGHIALRLALEASSPRLRGIIAICPPLDLALASEDFDHAITSVYRWHVLAALKQMYARLTKRRRTSLQHRSPVWIDSPTVVEIRRIRTIRQWDALTIAPRFGYESVASYYAAQSVGPQLKHLKHPTLVISSENDPIVLAKTVKPRLAQERLPADIRWTSRGGHVGFPPDIDFGLSDRKGLVGQIVGWCNSQGAP